MPLKEQKPLRRISWILFLVTVAIWIYALTRSPGTNETEASYDELLSLIHAGRVDSVDLRASTILVTLKPEKADALPNVRSVNRLPGIPEADLIHELEDAHVKFSGHPAAGIGWLQIVIGSIVPLLILGALYLIAMRRLASSQALTFGKNQAKIYDESRKIGVTFDDVAGVDEAKAELVEVVDFLKNPDKYQKLGGRIPRGVLLVGPPGTGKTLLAKAVAGEAGVAFFSISGSNFVEMFVGVGAARVRDLFEQAKEKAPCIVFIDELDAIGKTRSGIRSAPGANDEREQTLNQLLVEMDGFDSAKTVIIVAATNAPELLDPALIRPGRFDRQVVVDRPDVIGRGAILKVHSRKVKLASDVDLGTIAARTPGMVGSDLSNIVNEAALLAAQRDAAAVEMSDMEEAIDRVMLGLERRTRVMSTDEKTRVAYHEAGHTLVALSVKGADPVHRVSIIPRSVAALGYTLQLPTHERFLLTQAELDDRIAVMLGGRAAEEIAFDGEISTGASDDLEKASELVRQMIMRFGMSNQLGKVTYGHSAGSTYLYPGALVQERVYSELTAQRIDDEVRGMIDREYHRVRSILDEKRIDLNALADALVQRETLTRAEINSVLGLSEPTLLPR